ncbi:MAG: hypothetical protein HXS48_23145 [Theionarchaea archaeon]|nr:MAG: hypothetical protein AYK19_06775 [Theionarchaea archaeon DG-70-1]MBU7029850.1 hypothetical protein [Theionarchaea archaeon]
MKKTNSQEEKVYYSVAEIEREFLPKFYREKVEREREKEPGSFGSELAMKFLENVKHQLAKK